MRKKFDVIALGELLIDFTEAEKSQNGNKLFEQNPGGAPANLLAAVSQMGYRTAFIGKVGMDMHGNFLKNVLEEKNICTDYLLQDSSVFTTLAFVELDANGERHFSFARKPGADTCLSTEELKKTISQEKIFDNCHIFHVGSLSLTDEPAKSATFYAVSAAKKAGAIISYDPNYRASLWKSEKQAVERMRELIPYADLIKVSQEESLLLTGETAYANAAEKILEMGPKLVAVTMGEEGVLLAKKGQNEIISGFSVKAIDTTGAGDSFWGGFLSVYLQKGIYIKEMQWEDWKECAKIGNAVAALCVQKRGGLPAIPTKEEVMQFLNYVKAKKNE